MSLARSTFVLSPARQERDARRSRNIEGELSRLEWETRRNEVIHLLALILTGCILVFGPPQLTLVQVLLIFAINLYANVYPICVQRYNRF